MRALWPPQGQVATLPAEAARSGPSVQGWRHFGDSQVPVTRSGVVDPRVGVSKTSVEPRRDPLLTSESASVPLLAGLLWPANHSMLLETVSTITVPGVDLPGRGRVVVPGRPRNLRKISADPDPKSTSP